MMIEFSTEGGMAPGYLARPAGDAPRPGVVVIQEWWGLNRQIMHTADRLAEAGFVALVPDLYHGQVTTEPNEARKLAMSLNRSRALAEIQGAVNYLVGQQFVAPARIGVTGFCMGGALAMVSAWAGQHVGAVVVFYGGGVDPGDAELQAVSAPLLGLYGAEDTSIPVERVRTWERTLAALGKPAEFVIYPGAGHAFFNEDRPGVYHPEAAADAWRRTLAWFERYLTPSS